MCGIMKGERTKEEESYCKSDCDEISNPVTKSFSVEFDANGANAIVCLN